MSQEHGHLGSWTEVQLVLGTNKAYHVALESEDEWTECKIQHEATRGIEDPEMRGPGATKFADDRCLSTSTNVVGLLAPKIGYFQSSMSTSTNTSKGWS
jgi:hypothetical protein